MSQIPEEMKGLASSVLWILVHLSQSENVTVFGMLGDKVCASSQLIKTDYSVLGDRTASECLRVYENGF